MSSTSTKSRQELIDLYESALDARHDGRAADGIALCVKAISILQPEEKRMSAILHSELGLLTEMTGDVERAIGFYRIAVEAAPRTEYASLQLFFALVKQTRFADAFAEAYRFTSLRGSVEYRALFSPSFAKNLPERERALADQVRQNLADKEN